MTVLAETRASGELFFSYLDGHKEAENRLLSNVPDEEQQGNTFLALIF